MLLVAGIGAHDDTYIVVDQLADLAGATVRDGKDLDKLGFLNIVDFGSRESSGKIDTPMRTEPEEGLERGDNAAPDKRPLLSAEILVVEVLVQIVVEEHRPDKGKWPDISPKKPWKRLEKLGMVDFGIVNERRRHDGGDGRCQRPVRMTKEKTVPKDPGKGGSREKRGGARAPVLQRAMQQTRGSSA